MLGCLSLGLVLGLGQGWGFGFDFDGQGESEGVGECVTLMEVLRMIEDQGCVCVCC